jgi:hypothetical protein
VPKKKIRKAVLRVIDLPLSGLSACRCKLTDVVKYALNKREDVLTQVKGGGFSEIWMQWNKYNWGESE